MTDDNTTTPEPHHVLIADDHQLVRDGLRMVLAATPDFICVGEATDGEEVLQLATTLAPDIIIMDLNMPEIDGIQATRLLLRDQPTIRVVALTMYDDDLSVSRALEAGARGYLLKGARHEEIVQTLRTIIVGGLVVSGSVAAGVLSRLTRPISAQQQPFPQLTRREHEVLDLLCAGLADHRISHRLGIEQKTVRNHVSNMMAKAGCENRLELVVTAREQVIGPVNREG